MQPAAIDEPRPNRASRSSQLSRKSTVPAIGRMMSDVLEPVVSFLDITRASAPGEIVLGDEEKGGEPVKIVGASLVSSVINLVHTVAGTGILGLPFAFSKIGLATGTLFLLLGALSSVCSFYVLAQSAIKTRISTFTGLGDALRPGFSVVVNFFIICNCLGGVISYLVVASTAFEFSFGASRALWVGVATALATPLVLLDRMDSLRVTSALGIAVLVAFGGFVAVSYFEPFDMVSPCGRVGDDSCKGDVVALAPSGWEVFLSEFNVFLFAYCGQTSLLPIIHELHDPSPRRVVTVLVTAVLGVLLPMYGLFTYFGYLSFGANVHPDILDSYPQNGVVTLFRVGLGAAVITNIPLLTFAVRKALMGMIDQACGSLCRPAPSKDVAIAPSSLDTLPAAASRCERFRAIWIRNPLEFALALVLIAACAGAALLTDNLGLVQSVAGAVGAVAMTFLLPGLFYFAFFREAGCTAVRVGSLGMLVLGMVLLPLSLALVFL